MPKCGETMIAMLCKSWEFLYVPNHVNMPYRKYESCVRKENYIIIKIKIK